MEAVANIYLGESKTLAHRVNEFLKSNNMTIKAFASELNYSRSAISQYLSGKYVSDPTPIETRIEEYLNNQMGCDNNLKPLAKVIPLSQTANFLESRDSSSVIGVCSSCQEFHGLGIVVGKSGYGKTHALEYYAKMPRVAYIECDDTMACRDLVEAIERSLGIPQTYGTIWKRVNGIREFFHINHGYLLIIDEADKLINKYTQKKMEILRSIFDQSDVGMVIAGEPKLESMIKGYLARFANRVDFYASLKGLSSKEVEKYLEGFNVEPDALSELSLRACNLQTGCFRLLDRTLKNAIRIMNENALDTITLQVIGQASNMMML